MVSLIAGISLLDALPIVHVQPGSPWALVAASGFALTLLGQRRLAGT